MTNHSINQPKTQNGWTCQSDLLKDRVIRCFPTVDLKTWCTSTGFKNWVSWLRWTEWGTDLAYGPEVFAGEVFGGCAGLQVILPGESAQPHQLAVAVQRVPAKAQHQRRERRALHLGVHGDPEEERVGGDLLQLVRRHVQSEDRTHKGELSWPAAENKQVSVWSEGREKKSIFNYQSLEDKTWKKVTKVRNLVVSHLHFLFVCIVFFNNSLHFLCWHQCIINRLFETLPFKRGTWKEQPEELKPLLTHSFRISASVVLLMLWEDKAGGQRSRAAHRSGGRPCEKVRWRREAGGDEKRKWQDGCESVNLIFFFLEIRTEPEWSSLQTNDSDLL